MFEEKKIELEVGGKQVTVKTGHLARQAAGSVELTCGDTVLLATVTNSEQPRDGIDFFPLLVEYEEKLYSIGKIPGSYNRREGRASDKAILTSRLIDRPVRPLFPEGYRNDVQISIITLSTDQTCPPDTLAMLAAGFALELSGVPFEGPLGSTRVALDENGEFIINPSEEEMIGNDLDLVVSGTADSIMMVEAGASFVPEDTVISAIAFAHEEIKRQVAKIAEFGKTCGVERQSFTAPEKNAELTKLITEAAHDDLIKSMQNAVTKEDRKVHFDAAKEKAEDAVFAALEGRDAEDALVQYLDDNPKAIDDEMKYAEKTLLRKQILETGVRSDGRDNKTVRELDVRVGLLPRVHGDGVFTRGSTQVMSILTLGTDKSARYLDGLDSEEQKFYMHNYNFPAFSVGEVRPNRGPGRREIGHGALAERAIIPTLPSREDFPYTIRVVSEVLESAGSTSMGATCASTLALMNGGVPIKAPVAGVAMGLIKGEDKYVVLTDIRDIEDFLGDMDFKVTGSADGITALQMDIKVKGISMDIISDAIKSAYEGRKHIMDTMLEVIPEPSEELRESAPRIISTTVDTDKIGAVIGPSGKNIKWIIEETGAEINIDDDGTVNIFSTDLEACDKAKYFVELIANGVQMEQVYTGEVVKILEKVGAIVEICPGVSGLIHISQIDYKRVEVVEDYMNIGDEVEVKVIDIDTMKGRVSLSTKALKEPPEGYVEPERNKSEDKPRSRKPRPRAKA